MLSTYSQRHRVAVRTTLSLSWGFAGAAGISATALTTVSNTVVRELGAVLTVACGLALFLGCTVAMWGVARDRYRFEWSGSWFAAFGISPYVVSIWAVVSTGGYTRTTQALLVTSLMLFFVARALLCGAHASRLRALHEAGEEAFHAGNNVDDSSGHTNTGA